MQAKSNRYTFLTPSYYLRPGNIYSLLEQNHISTAYLEEILSNEINQEEAIIQINNLFKLIETKLERPSRKDKSDINNMIKYYYFSNSTEDNDILLYQNAVENYNKIYNQTLSIEDIESEPDSTKEKLGQIINILNILDGEPINPELANEYQEFIKIFIGKSPLKNRALQALVALENYFNSDDEQIYLLKNFEPIAQECILDQEIMKVFMDKIYSKL